MGSLEQKMMIAFRCYDMDNDEQIEFSEIKIILRNIPLHTEGRYGSSFMKDNSRVEYLL
jgi:Ca2+-binding EF-hand superfamily protein